MVSNIYDILGISENASPTEVKKAYFKLIRVHTPESDPEGFRKIREAYDAYLRGEVNYQGDFQYSDEIEKAKAAEIAQLLDHNQYAQAKKLAADTLQTYPKSDHIQYLYCMALRRCSNTTTAIKVLEPLMNKDPENKLYTKEYALSCRARKWNQKAARAFAKALKAGVHDPEFIDQYLEFVIDSNYVYSKEEINDIFDAYFSDLPERWNESNTPLGVDIVTQRLFRYDTYDLPYKVYIDNILDMVTQMPSAIGNEAMETLAYCLNHIAWFYIGEEAYESLLNTSNYICNLNVLDKDDQIDHQYFIRYMKLHSAYNISNHFCYVLEHYFIIKETQNASDRFLRINMQLGILTDEKGFTEEEMALIAKEYPQFYREFRVSFEKLSLPKNKLDANIKQLKSELGRFPYPTFYDCKYDEDKNIWEKKPEPRHTPMNEDDFEKKLLRHIFNEYCGGFDPAQGDPTPKQREIMKQSLQSPECPQGVRELIEWILS